MLTEVTFNYIDRINGVPLYYNGLNSYHHISASHSPFSAGTFTGSYYPISQSFTNNYDILMQGLITPPLSPPSDKTTVPENNQRTSVIMKVENSQIRPAKIEDNSEEFICKWVGCFR